MFIFLIYIVILIIAPLILSFLSKKSYKIFFMNMFISTIVSAIITFSLFFVIPKIDYHLIPLIGIIIFLLSNIIMLKRIYLYSLSVTIITATIVSLPIILYIIYNSSNQESNILIYVNKNFTGNTETKKNYVVLVSNLSNKKNSLYVETDKSFEIIKPKKIITLLPKEKKRFNIIIKKSNKDNNNSMYNLYFITKYKKIEKKVSF